MKTTKRRRAALPEYDFSKGVRGKYAARFPGGTLVVLDPDVAKTFRTSESVNAALRAVKGLAKLAEHQG